MREALLFHQSNTLFRTVPYRTPKADSNVRSSSPFIMVQTDQEWPMEDINRCVGPQEET